MMNQGGYGDDHWNVVDGQQIDPATFTVSAPPLRIDTYETTVLGWAKYPNRGRNIFYPALGLCGEAGEVAEHAKKWHRDDGNCMTPERLEKVKKELGDVLWYSAAVASEVGSSLVELLCVDTFVQLDHVRHGRISNAAFLRESLMLCKYTGLVADTTSIIDDDSYIHYGVRSKLKRYLRNVIDTLSTICIVVGTDIETVAALNIEKLAGRCSRGTIQGSGDDR